MALKQPEMLAQNASVRAAEIDVRRAKNDMQPDILARVDYSVNGLERTLDDSLSTLKRNSSLPPAATRLSYVWFAPMPTNRLRCLTVRCNCLLKKPTDSANKRSSVLCANLSQTTTAKASVHAGIVAGNHSVGTHSEAPIDSQVVENGAEPKLGVADFFRGEAFDVDQLICVTKYPNLSRVRSGTTTLTGNLLVSGKLGELFDQLK